MLVRNKHKILTFDQSIRQELAVNRTYRKKLSCTYHPCHTVLLLLYDSTNCTSTTHLSVNFIVTHTTPDGLLKDNKEYVSSRATAYLPRIVNILVR